MAANISQIPAPRVPLVDVQTNTVSREWFMWFNNIYSITGGGVGIVAVINGGTGLGTIPANGQLLIGNGIGYTLNTLGYGTGISITNAAGSITITNTLPDRTVVLTGAGTTTVTGTYPNFTITSNDAFVGTVTSVAALTLGTTGTDLTSTVANSTTTPVITLNVPTASATNRGALSSADWTTFNNKGSGTVTSVGGTGTVNGITLTGTVTSTGNLTLGGTLSGVSLTTQVSGILPVVNGGTGTGVAYTVATLPTAGTQGRRAWVTDALAPAFGAAVVGGGAVVIPVFDTGAAWIVG